MEEMKKAATACYERADAETKEIAKQFFKSMDKDGNGKITHNEFLEALKQLSCNESEEKELANLFEKFDTNRDKQLDFNEAVAFFYVIKHKNAVFCSGCCALLASVYFSCLECHESDGKTYDLCIDCYRKGKSDDHMHKTLYDNHHLLQLYRNLRANEEATNIEGNVTASSGGKRYMFARLIPKVFKTVSDPDSSSNGTGTGNAGSGLAVDGIESAGGVGVAKRGLGLGPLSDLADACSIM